MTAMLRPAAVAGLFYPGDAAGLDALVTRLLAQAPEPPSLPRIPRAFIVPHAGLIYSGPVAAAAYRTLQQWLPLSPWRRVLLLGPNHRLPLSGMAVSAETGWQTPLGRVLLDRTLIDTLCRRFGLESRSDVHRPEHALEVQLPFLQRIDPELRLVPVLVGPTEPEAVAALIEYSWQDASTLVLVSSDLSHYHPWQQARRLDAQTGEMICRLEARLVPEQACGCHAVNGLLLAAQRQGLQMQCLNRMTSGDTAGDKQQVVGYGAYVCY